LKIIITDKIFDHSEMSQHYGINGIEESKLYTHNDILSARLREICDELLLLETSYAEKIFGGIGAVKLRSSMTLDVAMLKCLLALNYAVE
jgi:uncharacterized protein (DUF1810 family)